MPAATPNDNLSREDAFLIFATFCGDCVQTGAALGVPPSEVAKIADREGWLDTLRPILDLKSSARPGDVDRAINRAVNFVQAHRFRAVLQRAVSAITDLTDEQLTEKMTLTKKDKDGEVISATISAKVWADLSSALEKAHSMTYAALGDSMGDRAKRTEAGGSDSSAADLHTALAAAMAKVSGSTSPVAKVFDVKLSEALSQTKTQLAKETESE